MTWTEVAAVVFDCDGVIADSEPVIAKTWTELLRTRGFRPTDEELNAAVGTSFAATHATYARRMPGLPTPTQMQGEADRLYLDLLPTWLRPFPDGVELARSLHQRGIPLALASSSVRRRLDATLRHLDLHACFALSVAGDEVSRQKPEPEAYLRAAQLLDTPPERCLAIEDSAAGLAAAVTAGMRTVAVRRPGRKFDLGAADVVVDDLREIAAKLPPHLHPATANRN